jgi:hypothetical protein
MPAGRGLTLVHFFSSTKAFFEGYIGGLLIACNTTAESSLVCGMRWVVSVVCNKIDESVTTVDELYTERFNDSVTKTA